MSKETPITAHEFYNSNTNLTGYELMEQYAQAKVLEALEEKSKTAQSILGTLNDMHSNDEINYDRYTYLFNKVASIQLDETE